MPVSGAVAKPIVLAHSIPETAEMIGVSRSKIYELFDTGELSHLKIGRRTLIERSEIERFLAAHRVGG